MTRINVNPDTFVDDALEGFALVHHSLIERVDGGVVRRAPLADGRVALVIGGGSGHYPAFAGTVGPGLAAGAVCGQVFTSPSAGQAYRVAKAAHAGGGVLYSYGNYAGDVLHFDEAQEKLRGEGIDCRTLLVTDDVASAPLEERDKRRGIAGDLVVFKIAGAAAEEGASLDEVERVARAANAATVTMGVAFDGCTLPGATEPLFTVPQGQMSVGLGIHGEPGIRDEPMPSAAELAKTLVEPLLAERPDGAGRVLAMINGLGAVKYEEMFVLFKDVHALLEDAGLTVAHAECGELVTSLDMAGVSLTLTWLDNELERLWAAPALTPAFRQGDVGVSRSTGSIRTRAVARQAAPAEHARASDEGREASAKVLEGLVTAFAAIDGRVAELGELDSYAGDGDHGTGMARGLAAALEAATGVADAGPRTVLAYAGEAWAEHAGGTSGALWGAALVKLGEGLGDDALPDDKALAAAVADAINAVMSRGKASVGDKTMVDAMVPFSDVLTAEVASGTGFADAFATAAASATVAAKDTAGLRPRLGRARPLAERSVGHPDPGATSFAMIVSAIAAKLGGDS